MDYRKVTFALSLCLISSACTTTTAHENFLRIMSGNVGKSLDDKDLDRNRYPEFFVRTTDLGNGKVEEEYARGQGGRCRVFLPWTSRPIK